MAISSVLGSSALLPAGLGFRNTVINGHMRIAQRGTTAVSTNDSFPVDRWKFSIGTSGAWTAQQIPTATTATPAGFDYSLNFTKTTGGTAASGDYNYFVQYIEGNNCAHFDWGTANAKTLTLSFWVRSGATGTFGGSLRNSAANYAYCFTYTVNAINTWEYKTIQITGITAGTWLKDTSTGIALFFDLGSGVNARGTAGIATGNYVGTTGTSLYPNNTTGGYINFTGVQLEQNYQPTPFEQRPIGVELALCQRYYWRSTLQTTAAFFTPFNNVAYNVNTVDAIILFPVTMRAKPTAFEYASLRLTDDIGVDVTDVVPRALSSSGHTLNTANVTIDKTSGFTQRYYYALYSNTSGGYIAVSAEL